MMETKTSPKTPPPKRLEYAESAALDVYVAQFTDFPPSRVDVVRKALNEWIAQKLAPAPHTQAPQYPEVAEASASPLRQPLKAAWQPIVAFLQQRQNVPAQPAEIVAALGCKAE